MNKSVRVTVSRHGLSQKRTAKASRFSAEDEKRKFGRTPTVVGGDRELSPRDKLVYWALALFERTGVVHTGIRYMADACNVRPDAFCKSLKRLEERGHVKVLRSGSGKRSSYKLTSLVFATGRAARSGVGASADEETPTRVKPELSPCLKCRKLCRPSRLTRFCRDCKSETRIRVIAREEVAKFA